MGRRKTHPVHAYFEVCTVSAKAKCLSCSTSVNYKNYTISGMLAHLVTHPDLHQEMLEKLQNNTLTVAPIAPTYGPPQAAFFETVMMITKCLAFNLADSQDLRMLISRGQDNFTSPCSRQIRTVYLPRITKCIEDLVRLKIEMSREEMTCASLCFDAWKSPNRFHFLGTCLYYLDQDLVPHIFLLDLDELKKAHTAKNLIELVDKLFTSYPILKNIDSIFSSTDGASNTLAAARGSDINHKNTHCVCHRCNLCLATAFALAPVKALIDRANATATKLNNLSPHRYKEIFGQDATKFPKYCTVRWNSFYPLVAQFVKMKNKLKEFRDQFDSQIIIPDDDFVTMEKILPTLAQFNKVTKSLESNQPAIFTILFDLQVLLIGLRNTLKVVRSGLAHQILCTIYLELRKRFILCGYAEPLFLYGSLLNPSDKGNTFSKIIPVADVFEHLLKDVRFKCSTVNIPPMKRTRSSDPYDLARDQMNQDFHKVKLNALSRASIYEEFNIYLNYYDTKEFTNTLDFWRQHKIKFPQLYQIVRSLGSILITSVPSERVFSAAKLQVSDLRHNLKAETIRKLTYSKINRMQLNDDETLCKNFCTQKTDQEENEFIVPDHSFDPNHLDAEIREALHVPSDQNQYVKAFTLNRYIEANSVEMFNAVSRKFPDPELIKEAPTITRISAGTTNCIRVIFPKTN